MFATDETVVLAEWINDDTCLVLLVHENILYCKFPVIPAQVKMNYCTGVVIKDCRIDGRTFKIMTTYVGENLLFILGREIYYFYKSTRELRKKGCVIVEKYLRG